VSDTIGKLFTVTSFGESHGRCVGVVVSGCPAGLPLEIADIQKDVDRRRPSAVAGSTARAEEDKVEMMSGVFAGRTTGAPICLMVWNRDVDSSQYERMRFTPRPGHADYTAQAKYGGFNDYRGGGRFSGRLTAGFVMAGAVARKLLRTMGVEVLAHTIAIGGVTASARTMDEIRETVNGNPVRCSDVDAARRMTLAIENARREGDSLGGIVEGIARGVPPGLGEPMFDTLEGELAKALFAIPAVKGVEFGAGFGAAGVKGSQNNDPFVIKGEDIATATNNSGGILGGISNGMPVVVRAAIKPTPSISLPQITVDLREMTRADLNVAGRHDACIVPRAVPVIESMIAVTLADLSLRAGVLSRVIK
jgi:chorismate synthase